jgi:tetratricopeptide (TPR) repeat protein
MAKKKRKPDGRPAEPSMPEPRSKPRSRPKGSQTGPIQVDWKVIEQAMWRMLGREAPADEGDPRSPRSLAGNLVHQAYRTDDPARVARLARQALEVWPDCADAYVLLAEQTRGPKEALDLYARGLEAAARDLGESAFRIGVGHFWSALPTRPYMRARLGLAQMLWVLGRRIEAVEHYNELLRLNPDDNQGVRYLLASALIELGHDEWLADLLARYQEDSSACWPYSAALLAFRREGDSARSRRLLAAAKRANPHVPDFLTGRETFPSVMPDGVGRGDRNEAVDYAAGFLNGWRGTPGAVEWLRRSESKAKPKPRREPATRGPTPASKKRLARLPRNDDVWQADARLLPLWINVPDDPYRPWVIVVASLTEGLILGQEVCEVWPSPEFFWDKLAKLMETPSEDRPHRPEAIEIGSGDRWVGLVPHFAEVGVRCEPMAQLDLIDDVVKQLVEHVNGRPPMPGLLDMPGIGPDQVAGFYRAAAEFYRDAPWQRVGGAETIKVACDRFESGPWYAVIFGQMGMTLGLALYDDLETLVRIRDGSASDEQNARATVALSLTYGIRTEVAVPDLDAAEEHGWEVAAPDAYPSPVRKERGLVMRPPLAWELQLLEAVLRALPGFVTGHDRDDRAPGSRTVATAAGPLRLEFSWIDAGTRT